MNKKINWYLLGIIGLLVHEGRECLDDSVWEELV